MNVLIIGATSAIAQAVARIYADLGAHFVLGGRRDSELQIVADDLKVRGAASTRNVLFDATDLGTCEALLRVTQEEFQKLDVVLIAHGTLPDQRACETDSGIAMRELSVNGVSTIYLMGLFAEFLRVQGSGSICVVSSVAGERGRQSNYLYGSAKSAVSTFAEGLQHSLFGSGVSVSLILPGFVDTPMTANFEKGMLWATPETVAKSIHRAICRKSNKVYAPSFWRWIMLCVRWLPRWLFHRTNL